MDTNHIINQEKIFNRQFERCKSDLLQVNCPQIFIDCVSKYFNFAKQDIVGLRNEEKECGKETNFNK